jgi:hypothetical protein
MLKSNGTVDLIAVANASYARLLVIFTTVFGHAEPEDVMDSVIDALGEHYFVYLRGHVNGGDVIFELP